MTMKLHVNISTDSTYIIKCISLKPHRFICVIIHSCYLFNLQEHAHPVALFALLVALLAKRYT